MKKLLILILLFPVFAKANLLPHQFREAKMYLSGADYIRSIYSSPLVTLRYVSTSSGGTNSGTLSNPWTSVSSMTSNQGSFSAGDFILFKCGDTFTSGQINITVSGSAGNPITFGNYSTGDLPMFTGNGTQLSNLFYMNSRAYLTFTGLRVVDPSIDTMNAARDVLSHIERAFTFDNSSNHCIAQNMSVTACGLFVFYAIGSSSNTARDNYANYLTMIVDDPGGTNDYGCNFVVNAGNNNSIYHAYGTGLYGHSFDFTWDGGNDIISTGAGTADNFRMDYCFFSDCIGVVEIAGTCTGTIVTYGNILNCGQTITFQSGTIDFTIYQTNLVETTAELPGQSDKMLNAGSGKSVTVKGCNFWLVTGIDAFSSATGVTKDYNIIHTAGGSSYGLSLNTHEATTASNIWQTQSGAALGWNYHLSSTSAAIGAGVVIVGLSTTDYFGNPIGVPPNTGFAGAIPPTNSVISPFYNTNAGKNYMFWR